MTEKSEFGNIEWISLDKLSVIWVKSQRPFNEKWGNLIAEEFDPEKFEPPTVTKPNSAGVFHIVEGQHRVYAASKALGPTQKVQCRVLPEGDPAKAAENFLSMNNRKALQPVIEFNVAVEAGRSPEVEITKIVKKAEYKVGMNRKAGNTISAVGALKKIYNRYGENVLLYTLQTCRLLWSSDGQGVAGPIIGGLGIFINEFHSHIDSVNLRKKLHDKYKSPGNFLEAARVQAERSSENLDVAVATLARVRYNHGLQEGKKLKRKES